MAAIPKRASALEQLVHNQVVDDKLIAGAGAALATDFQPLSDARASADYRLQVATNLFRRLCIETGQEAVVSRVGDHV
jgi:xanthine dehydrogenase small subunit